MYVIQHTTTKKFFNKGRLVSLEDARVFRREEYAQAHIKHQLNKDTLSPIKDGVVRQVTITLKGDL